MPPKLLLTAEQIQRRVKEMGQQISRDYSGKRLMLICVLQNGFVFAADLLRSIDIPVLVQFVQPQRKSTDGPSAHVQIHYGPEFDVKGKEVVLVEGLVQSGQTTEFLMRTIQSWGAASVKLAALVDKQTARRVPVQPDYMGFILEETYIVGYGMGDPDFGRNLPHIQSGLR
ncbi:MAG: hypoxanthine phosphoribosyltransferase [Acidobacteria bacterium]|nr:hypoxanthine phosphoribosyltransferase [Acidobacteriota bacterium]MBV9145987.1 hypoxanthine phosphoribosyltransferase [Acidobacteriota bacterium]MBV9435652.1 hypoxanthine phosphoribosyltransferase [Acidobacteriota bacterium]